MSEDRDRGAWNPARSGTALGKLISFLVARRMAPDPSSPAVRSQQTWQNRWELLAATAFWCFLPPLIAAALVAPSITSWPARAALWAATPVLTPLIVQLSIFAVGGLVFLLRLAGLLRHASDGRLQLLAWGCAGTVLAAIAFHRGGLARLLGLLWAAVLTLEMMAHLLLFAFRNRIEELQRSMEER